MSPQVESTAAKQAIASRVLGTEPVRWRELRFLQDATFKALSETEKQKLKASVLANEFAQPFYVWRDISDGVIYCLDGRHRTMVLEEMIAEGHTVPDVLPATFIHCDSKTDAAKLVLVYSSSYARITEEGLAGFLETYDLNLTELSESISLPEFDLAALLPGGEQDAEELHRPSLQDRFLVPPFSVLDARQGYWQDRKRQWLATGIDSQETREDVEIIAKSGQSPAVYALRNAMREAAGVDPSWDEVLAEAKRTGLHVYEGASIFDPVLCEVVYRWFCPANAVVLDPFAGGSVRGIVAAKLGHIYHGIDLRPEQVEANRRQAEALGVSECEWYAGDSLAMDELLPESVQSDFIFSCPPYHDLEKYSDDPADLSNMSYKQFVVSYQLIIAKAVQRLKPSRFACFVVGDIRDEQGFYRNFLQDTIDAFQHSGECRLYNEIILVTQAGSLPIRVGRQFAGGRKVGKTHQNVLVFYKGDPKKIKQEFPEINVAEALDNLTTQPNIALSTNEIGNEHSHPLN